MSSLYKLSQLINDKSIELDVLLTELDEALANTVTIQTVYEDETGRHFGEIDTYDEDGVDELRKLYNKLDELILGG